MSKQNQLKQAAAEAALHYVDYDSVIGIGTGSTINYFIDALAKQKHKLAGAVASSIASAERLKALGIPLCDLNSTGELTVYIDGADEFNSHGYLIKGGGGALTREKIIAAASKNFICIVDESKQVDVLGKFPLAIEVIPIARSYVARQLTTLGGEPEYRQGFISDNGNVILDVYHLDMLNPIELEKKLNNIVGIVCHGLFALRGADKILIAKNTGVETLIPN